MKKIFIEKVSKLNIIDYIIFILILVLCSIVSFHKLGDTNAPNTFYRSNEKSTIKIDLKDHYYIDNIKIFNGEKTIDSSIHFLINDDNQEIIMSNRSRGAFSWDVIYPRVKNCRYIEIVVNGEYSYGEIGVYSHNKLIKNTKITVNNKEIKLLNDEQEYIPSERSYMNSTYFDEIYFARTAYEYVYNLKIYEWTHPPLGKIIQAIPIFLTHKMTPFNYRFMGCLSGVLLVCVMYLFGVIVFKKRYYGLLTAIVTMLDTARFAHTRMGTVDSHLVLFITLSIMFMYLYTDKDKLKYFILSGIFFALSISIKWTAFYSGIALALIYFIYIIRNKKFNFDHIIHGSIFFVFIPILIYCSSFLLFPNNYYKTNNLQNIVKQNKLMYDYHSKLKDQHYYSSKWYTWPISYKPVWYHDQKALDTKKRESITGVGNIVIWYTGIASILYLLIKLIFKRDKKAIFLLICYFSMWLPFAFIPRIMYLYHYFPVLPILFLTIVYFLRDIYEVTKFKSVTTVFIILALIFYILYYPVISGKITADSHIVRLRLFDSWYF